MRILAFTLKWLRQDEILAPPLPPSADELETSITMVITMVIIMVTMVIIIIIIMVIIITIKAVREYSSWQIFASTNLWMSSDLGNVTNMGAHNNFVGKNVNPNDFSKSSRKYQWLFLMQNESPFIVSKEHWYHCETKAERVQKRQNQPGH